QFVTPSGSGPNFWVFKARSPRTNVGFFNRYKPQVCRANLNVRIGGMESRPQRHLAHVSGGGAARHWDSFRKPTTRELASSVDCCGFTGDPASVKFSRKWQKRPNRAVVAPSPWLSSRTWG